MYKKEPSESGIINLRDRIMALQEAVNIIPAIKETVCKFDGKVYNVRFEKALNDLGFEHRVSVDKSPTILRIGYYVSHRTDITIAYVPLIKAIPEKRIIADEIIWALNDKREQLLKECAEIENDLSRINEVFDQVNHLGRLMENVINSVSSRTRSEMKLSGPYYFF